MGSIDTDLSTLSIRPPYINGRWRQGGEGAWAESVNPATGLTYARIAQASATDVDEAIASAHQTHAAWAAVLAGERAALLLRAADVIVSRANEISGEPHIAFGGVKGCFGRECGQAAIEEMTELKWITAQMGRRAHPF